MLKSAPLHLSLHFKGISKSLVKLFSYQFFLNEHSTRCNQVDYISKVKADVREREKDRDILCVLLVQSRWHCKLNFSLHFSAVYKVPFFFLHQKPSNFPLLSVSHCVNSLNYLKVFPQQFFKTHFLSLHEI